jgi:DNA replication protein DnaD
MNKTMTYMSEVIDVIQNENLIELSKEEKEFYAKNYILKNDRIISSSDIIEFLNNLPINASKPEHLDRADRMKKFVLQFCQ